MESELSALLREMRLQAGCSQLELSLRLGVSQRHVNFIERDRSRPSRPLLLAWLRAVGSSASQSTAAMLHAGYAPARRNGASPGSPTHSDSVLLRAVALHHPYPAMAFDADWYVVQANPASRWLCEVVMPGVWQGERLDMLAALAHPGGWLACAREPARIAGALLGQLRAEQWMRPELRRRIDALEDSLACRYGKLELSADRDPSATSFNATLDTQLGPLAFCAVQARAGLPNEDAGAGLRVELWFPADDHTASVMRLNAP